MKTPKIILVPTDFSVAAETALDRALDLAAKLEAKVYVLHSYELPIVGFLDSVLLPNAKIASGIVTWAQTELDACISKRNESSVSITPLLRQGDPRALVLSVAAEIHADLIVMGTHGRRGLARALIGSTTESVVRTSPVPVMTIHAGKI